MNYLKNGGKIQTLTEQNLAKLYALYPDYPERVQAFIAADPLRAVRARINLPLLRGTAPRFVLHVMHGWGGGVEVAVRDLCARLAQAKEGALILSASANGGMLLSLPGGGLPISYAPATPMAVVCKDLRTLGVWHVHIHQTVGLPKEVWQIATALKAAYDFTVHDYFSVCPRVNFVDASGAFCGQAEVSVCEQCVSAETLDAQSRALFVALGGTVEAWRKFHLGKLKKARAIFAPSKDAARRMDHYTKLPQLRYRPHPESDIEFSPCKRAPKGTLRVAVIGAIGAHKGHKLLLATAAYAERKKLAIEFVVVGYTCDDDAYAALSNVKLLGAYKPEQLAGLLADSGCTVALFLSIWPETFSYTLSEAWRAGLVPVVTDLGAQAERVKREKIGLAISPASRPEDVVAACMKAGTGTRLKKKTIAGAAYDPLLPGYYALKAPGKVRKAMK